MSAYKTGADLIHDAKTRIPEIPPQQAVALHNAAGNITVFLDVRESNEWHLGHIPGALHIPRGQLELKVEGAIDRGRQIVVYCAAGGRSALAADTLRQMGYVSVTSLQDGFRGWTDAGGAIED